MRMNHTVSFYERMEAKYDFSNGHYRRKMTLTQVPSHFRFTAFFAHASKAQVDTSCHLQAFKELEDYVDASDPDLDLPNIVHLLQTAEAIRKDGHPDWEER